jgi:hypothetical protein
MMKLATCVVAVIGFIGTSAFAEEMAVEAPPPPPPKRVFGGDDIGASLGNVKTDFNAAIVSVTASAGNFTTPGFSVPNRVYPSGFMGDGHIGYTTYVTGGLAYGKVDWALRGGLNYQFH